MADNLKYSKHKQIREQGYLKYDNYDAIEVPFVDAIPSDYVENMGVPITYLQRHNPEQFEVVKFRKGNDDKDLTYTVDSGTILTDRQTDRQTDAELRRTSESSSDARCNGVMGVPITFLFRHSPEQFEIIGLAAGNIRGLAGITSRTGKDGPYINGKLRYGRIFIKRKM